MFRKIMALLNAHPDNEYKLLGYVEFDGLNYVLVTSSEEGEFEVVSVFEIDEDDVSEYGIALTEGDTALHIFKEWCRREIHKSDAGCNDTIRMDTIGDVN